MSKSQEKRLIEQVRQSTRESLKGFVGMPNMEEARAKMVAEVKKLFDLLDKTPFLEPQEGDYCELEDESQPDGMVVFKRKSGQIFMMMSRADYETFRSGKNPYKEGS